jgi:alanyl-tRNA synthetase
MKLKQVKYFCRNNTKSGIDSFDNSVKNVIDGRVIFYMMDSQGMSFDILMDLLNNKNMGFDVETFIIAAKESKNYRKDRLRLLFEYSSPNKEKYLDFMEKVDYLLDKIFD